LIFFKAIKDFQPEFIAACFDFPAPTLRHKKYKEYKAKRPPAPEELYLQIPKVKDALRVFGVPIFEKEGFEADDLIGTIVRLAPKKQILPPIEIIILSGDLDLLQLIDSKTKAYILRRGVKDAVLYDQKTIKEKFQGLEASQLLDFKAIKGDPSDNIPGITGIGEKGALDLILKFGSLENLYREIEENSSKAKELKPKLKELLLKYREQAFFSKSLVEINQKAPIDFNLKKCRWEEYSREKAEEFLLELGFRSLIARLPKIGSQNTKELQKEIKKTGKNLTLW
jgi:DNA polymerase-1